MPPRWNCMIPGDSSNPHMHRDIIENFGKAILYGEPLTACASEGIRGLALGNAMLLLKKEGCHCRWMRSALRDISTV